MNGPQQEAEEKLARLLGLLAPSRKEVRERHGALIARWVARPPAGPAPARLVGRVVELCQGFRVRLAEGMEEIQAGFGLLSLQSRLTTLSTSTPSAERAPGAAVEEPAGGRPWAFSCHGEGCAGRVLVRPQPDGKLTIELSLRDEQGHPIRPFFLTVQEPGRTVLDHKRIDGDAYEVQKVEPADLAFTLADEGGRRQVSMGWMRDRPQ